MIVTQTTYPGSVVNDGSFGVHPWLAPEHAESPGGGAASVNAPIAAGVAMQRLLATEFEGDDPVPADAAIQSVTFVVVRYSTGIVRSVDADVRVVLEGGELAPSDLAKADVWPTAYAAAEYVDDSIDWTPDLLNDQSSGFGISARNPAAPGHPLLVSTPFVDVISRVVLYEPA